MADLNNDMKALFENIKQDIQEKLTEYTNIPKEKYFYEFCFCICTPQSKAVNAFKVQQILEQRNFKDNPFDPAPILLNKDNYIRFHNQKAERLLTAREFFPNIERILEQNMSDAEKRIWIADNFSGVGMKESAHFMRNIGYRNLGILDRHILKHLKNCGVYDEIPNISSKKRYLEAERKFLDFADEINISVDELDLLFWSSEAGLILK